ADEAAPRREGGVRHHRGQPVLPGQGDNLLLPPSVVEQRIDMDQQRIGMRCTARSSACFISGSVLAFTMMMSTPMLRPTTTKALASAAFRFLGLTRTAMTAVLGFSSRSSWMRLGPSWLLMKLMPVTLPPGRLRLATRPYSTGSLPLANTIGMLAVAALAASAETTLPVA